MRLIEWFKAKQRKERRVAPYGCTGRVYEKVDSAIPTSQVGDIFNSKLVADVKLTARIIRADGTVEEL